MRPGPEPSRERPGEVEPARLTANLSGAKHVCSPAEFSPNRITVDGACGLPATGMREERPVDPSTRWCGSRPGSGRVAPRYHA